MNHIEKLVTKYSKVRQLTESLCEPLETEDYVVQPIEDVSPPKWHLAHTTWFFETFILGKYIKDYKPYHELYSYLFNSYYYHAGERWQRPRRGNLSRPTVKKIYKFRKAIDDRMIDLMHNLSEEHLAELEALLELGLNHEQQHQELILTDLKYNFALNPLFPVYHKEKNNDTAKIEKINYVHFSSGTFEIGYADKGFHYDNEQPVHKVYQQDFLLADRLVTNGEFLQFIESGGYRSFQHWLSAGWDTVQNQMWQHPLYWHKMENGWYEMTLSGLVKLNMNAPVTHVSFYEAEAYASWANKRLPTEAEWEIAVNQVDADPKNGYFVDDKKFHPQPVKKNGEKLMQMYGDVWEWTGSSYLPYPGYREAEGALGEYNGKFMIDQMVLRGGSCATSRGHIRSTYRNFFQTDKRWQFTGIRLADDAR